MKKAEETQITNIREELVEKTKELEQFAYVISHDLKSPLSSIMLTADMLRDSMKDSGNDRDIQLLDVLDRAAVKIRNLADSVLLYYRGEQALGSPTEQFELGPFVESVVEPVRLNRNAEIRFDQSKAIIRANKPALEQILINLLENAARYNDAEQISIDICFAESQSHYVFEVSDNGRGIAPEDQQKIFERFTTLGEPDRNGISGTGNGLAIVRKLVKKQGGEVSVKSVAGQGSRFSFTIRKDV